LLQEAFSDVLLPTYFISICYCWYSSLCSPSGGE
jgi:hypothetical protein